ncbi:uncharacterized protein LOC132846301 isoform X1 [Tachysurus vachellii]|uniref:uncharacterized protein LOC132846301 isoform X1 n=1 Tax=Tachysurus vachellii TaxID=175792 RepID=UPI00296A991D|nr:uncharacterized protein LOC132846301 isoform X1 [Tachysurus vachellii]
MLARFPHGHRFMLHALLFLRISLGQLESKFKNSGWNEETKKQLHEIKTESISLKGFITRYILNTRTVIDDERLKKVAFGEKRKGKPHKTMLIVGETGVGKSTLINAMVNYMLGVESKDRIWFEVIETKEEQSDSQTHAVTVYDVFTEHCPFSLTVIDTPGFGSTKGINEDLIVAEGLHELFKCKDGVDELNVVCLVMKSSTNRLTERQHYVFNAVLSLFGNDVEKNIVLFVTHAPTKPTNAIKVIKQSKVPCALTAKGEPVHFMFNNGHCEDFNNEEISDNYQASWNLLNTTMENFLSFLQELKPINLKITEAVLKKRKQLTSSIFGIKNKIIQAEQKQKELEQTKEALKEHEKKGDHHNWEYYVDEPYNAKESIEYSLWNMFTTKAMCCRVCEANCHYPGCWWVSDLSKCSMMSKGMCTVCECPVSNHDKEGKIYVPKTRRVKKTKEDLKKKYEIESGEIKTLMSRIENDMRKMEKEKSRLVEECYECVVLMEEIALKSDSVFTLQHMDFLIEKVKETGNTARVQKLQEMKNKMEEKSSKALAALKSLQ